MPKISMLWVGLILCLYVNSAFAQHKTKKGNSAKVFIQTPPEFMDYQHEAPLYKKAGIRWERQYRLEDTFQHENYKQLEETTWFGQDGFPERITSVPLFHDKKDTAMRNTEWFRFDTLGRIQLHTDLNMRLDSVATFYTYSNGHVTETISDKNQRVKNYVKNGRIVACIEYNDDSNLGSRGIKSKDSILYRYNKEGRVASFKSYYTSMGSGDDGTDSGSVIYTYNAAGQLITKESANNFCDDVVHYFYGTNGLIRYSIVSRKMNIVAVDDYRDSHFSIIMKFVQGH